MASGDVGGGAAGCDPPAPPCAAAGATPATALASSRYPTRLTNSTLNTRSSFKDRENDIDDGFRRDYRDVSDV
jgi:hypothetical protein